MEPQGSRDFHPYECAPYLHDYRTSENISRSSKATLFEAIYASFGVMSHFF